MKSRTKIEIVKVQLPIGSAYQGVALVYAKGHDRMREQRITQAVYDHVASLAVPKAFYKATWDPIAHEWDLGEGAEWQNW